MRPANRILHVDGDSFFASCEIALNPKLQERPVWVGGGRKPYSFNNRTIQKLTMKFGESTRFLQCQVFWN